MLEKEENLINGSIVTFEQIDLTGLSINKVVKELRLEDDGQGRKKNKSSEKTVRYVMQQLEGKKKPERFKLLFELYRNDPFWQSLVKNSDNLSMAAD